MPVADELSKAGNLFLHQTSDTPMVSIVTATRGRPDWLRLALQSIASQTLTEFESIVVDDGSEAAVLQQYQSMQDELGPRFHFHLPSTPGMPGPVPPVPATVASKWPRVPTSPFWMMMTTGWPAIIWQSQ
ncbi:MAG: glycosyltransferase [Phycisphaerales bacterium]|nr:glycosyltransferase [Phycisphaerales bacterium]